MKSTIERVLRPTLLGAALALAASPSWADEDEGACVGRAAGDACREIDGETGTCRSDTETGTLECEGADDDGDEDGDDDGEDDGEDEDAACSGKTAGDACVEPDGERGICAEDDDGPGLECEDEGASGNGEVSQASSASTDGTTGGCAMATSAGRPATGLGALGSGGFASAALAAGLLTARLRRSGKRLDAGPTFGSRRAYLTSTCRGT